MTVGSTSIWLWFSMWFTMAINLIHL